MTVPVISEGRFVAGRLRPGDDLGSGLRRMIEAEGIEAAALVTCVGSLTEVSIRHANQPEGTLYRGHFEIVSLVGTLDPAGEHLHIVISDGGGGCFGGHLLPGARIYTTAEIVLLILPGLRFTREPCALSGYDELTIRPKQEG